MGPGQRTTELRTTELPTTKQPTTKQRTTELPTTELRTREPAPAKLNLCLQVLGRRPDGRHALWSIAEPLVFGDEVEILLEPSAAAAPEVTCNCPGHPSLDGPGNLAAQAAARLLGTAPLRCNLILHKRIPPGAGLGGGSADAAATLRALHRLLGPRAPVALVESLAASLGADLPFCLRSQAALVTGWGDRLTPLALPRHWLCLLYPGVALSTAEVFARHDRLEAGREPRGETFPGTDAQTSLAPPATLEALASLVENDLLPAALALAPQVGEALCAMRRQGPLAAGMTGSGAAVFGIWASEAEAGRAAASLALGGWQAVATSPSPPGQALWPPPHAASF